jgi:hypothetical protein
MKLFGWIALVAIVFAVLAFTVTLSMRTHEIIFLEIVEPLDGISPEFVNDRDGKVYRVWYRLSGTSATLPSLLFREEDPRDYMTGKLVKPGTHYGRRGLYPVSK